MRIRHRPPEQQQLARAAASAPRPGTSPAAPEILTPWRPAALGTGGAARAASPGRSSPRRQLRSPVAAGRCAGLAAQARGAAPPARSCRAERGRPRPRERPPRAGLPWLPAPPGARKQRLRPPGGRRRLRGQTGPLLRADGEALAFSARGWRRLWRCWLGRERSPRAPCASDAERDGAGGARRAPRRLSR